MLTGEDGLMFQELTFRAMNTGIQGLLESSLEAAQLETLILEAFEQSEERFSRFLPTSECSYLNARSGQLCIISTSMLEVLELSRHYQEMTNGAFNIRVGHVLRQLGYRQSFERVRESHMEIDQLPCESASTMPIYVDASMNAIRIPAGEELDFGGIVKSWTAHQLANQLRKEWQVRRGLINAGGDVVVWGGATDDEPWLIGVANPHASDPFQEATLHLRSGAVATSSTLRRKWQTSQGEMHHLIDTRRMQPSQSTVVQCTVVGMDLMDCEVWAKVLCMLGHEEGVPLFQQRTQGMEAILYTSLGEILQVKPQYGGVELTWTGLKGVRSL
jgi:thiamine biosynthesis lipoprotein